MAEINRQRRQKTLQSGIGSLVCITTTALRGILPDSRQSEAPLLVCSRHFPHSAAALGIQTFAKWPRRSLLPEDISDDSLKLSWRRRVSQAVKCTVVKRRQVIRPIACSGDHNHRNFSVNTFDNFDHGTVIGVDSTLFTENQANFGAPESHQDLGRGIGENGCQLTAPKDVGKRSSNFVIGTHQQAASEIQCQRLLRSTRKPYIAHFRLGLG